jgi:hypothetical protein
MLETTYSVGTSLVKPVSNQMSTTVGKAGIEHWQMGINLFSTLSDLQQPPNFDKAY